MKFRTGGNRTVEESRRSDIFGVVGLIGRRILAASTVLTLSACNTTYLEERTDQPQNAADIVRATDLRPQESRPTGGTVSSIGSPPKAFSFFGSTSSETEAPVSPPPPGIQPVEGGYTLNFDNAPIAQVAKSVLGDVLGVGYVIDPRAQGTITLSTGRPIDKRDMLFVLENALHANNLEMVRGASGYQISPAGDGAIGATDTASAEPGYGMTVIPLRYVSGSTLSKLLEGFAARPGAIRTDPTGRLLIVTGIGSERQSAVETVRSFDVDWLQGQSVGMYPVQNSTPEPIVGELEKIMDSGESGLGHGLVKLQPVSRLNSILVVATKPELLRVASRWISRLDEPSFGTASVKVYKVRYGDAKQIAVLLQQIFVSGGGASLESPTNEIAPGSGAKPLSTIDRLTGGRPPPSGGQASSGESAIPNAANSEARFGAIPVAALNSQIAALGSGGAGSSQMSDVRVTADTVNNSVLVYARPDEYKLIERTLIQLDRPKLQVAIEVTIAEVTLNDQLNYGVQFYLNGGAVANTTTGMIPSALNNIASAAGATATGAALTGGLNIIAGNVAYPRVVINALQQLTQVRILSNPSLVVVDNGEASLEVGDQVPVTTGSATVLSANNALVNTVDYKNTGIILHVQPHIASDGSVLLGIDQEISSVPQGTTTLTPTISTRKVESSISVLSGQTVLLAGLINDQEQSSRQGIPVLNQLPYVGAAFGTTGKTDVRTELIMFIRPQIIRNGADAAEVAEQLRSKMRGGRTQALTLPAMLNINARPAQ